MDGLAPGDVPILAALAAFIGLLVAIAWWQHRHPSRPNLSRVILLGMIGLAWAGQAATDPRPWMSGLFAIGALVAFWQTYVANRERRRPPSR